MLLDESPAALLEQTIENFKIEADKFAVGRINETFRELQRSRESRSREAEQALKRTTRQLSTLASHHAELVSSHSSSSHASEIATLDTTKFRIAKSVSDLEIEAQRLASQLADMQARLQELDLQGVDGGASTGPGVGPAAAQRSILENEMLLKLKIYRSLGIAVDRDEKGEYTKVSVGDANKADLRLVNLDPSFSSYFYANYFWSLL